MAKGRITTTDVGSRDIMQNSYFLPEHVSVRLRRPRCPHCNTHMMLARIMPARVGYDLRTFECPQCDHVQVVMVATEAFGISFNRWCIDNYKFQS
jgi:hypothetical protein